MNVKRDLYKSNSFAIVIYGPEFLSISKLQQNDLAVMEMICLKSMCKVFRLDRVRCGNVRRRVAVREKIRLLSL